MSSQDSDARAESLASQADDELIAALRAGEQDALGILYDRHAGLVYGISLKILKNPQEAEDLTHDIFLQLAKAETYDPARSSLRTFLAILTRSRAVDRVRSHATRHRILQRDQPTASQSPTAKLPIESLFQREQSREIQDALSQLPDEIRQIMTLIYFAGLSQPAIAQRLNLPLTTVKARARRGLLKLRKILKGRNEPTL